MLHIIKNYRTLFLGLMESKLENWMGAAEAANSLNIDGLDASAVNAILDGTFKETHRNGVAKIETNKNGEKVKVMHATQEQVAEVKFDSLKGLRMNRKAEPARNKALQTFLQISVDGDFGPGTKRALQAFQKENGLTADGIVGKNTIAAMNKEANRGRVAESRRNISKTANEVKWDIITVDAEKVKNMLAQAEENYHATLALYKDCNPELKKEIYANAKRDLLNAKTYWNSMKGTTIDYGTMVQWEAAYNALPPCATKVCTIKEKEEEIRITIKKPVPLVEAGCGIDWITKLHWEIKVAYGDNRTIENALGDKYKDYTVIRSYYGDNYFAVHNSDIGKIITKGDYLAPNWLDPILNDLDCNPVYDLDVNVDNGSNNDNNNRWAKTETGWSGTKNDTKGENTTWWEGGTTKSEGWRDDG